MALGKDGVANVKRNPKGEGGGRRLKVSKGIMLSWPLNLPIEPSYDEPHTPFIFHIHEHVPSMRAESTFRR